MINKNNFYLNSKKFKKNLNKTQKIFQSFKKDFKDFKIPLLNSYQKDYAFDFTPNLINKFSKFDNIVIVGMGGSILGTKSIYSFFEKKIKKNIFFFDNLDINLNLKEIKNLKKTCFIIVSKSGNTIETISNLSLIFSKSLFQNKLIIITEIKNNALMNIAGKFNAEVIEHRDFLSGRYSVLSEVGMLPAALMKLNIKKFRNLENLINNKKFTSFLITSVASIHTLYAQGVKNSVILNYDTRLNDLSMWYQQLTAESLGKKGKGITPTISMMPKDNHSLLQLYLDGPKDKFFTFLNTFQKQNNQKINNTTIPKNMNFLKNKKIESIVNAQFEATKKIFKLKKIPFRSFIFNKNDEKELGLIFTYFVLETILLANLMRINPFDQPAVEQIKIETKKILSR